MLQLVAAGNVGLLRPGLEAEAGAPLQLQLLSLELQHTQMLGFQAPSLHDKVPSRLLCYITFTKALGGVCGVIALPHELRLEH